ncbi:MAG TPA: aspartyl protease family protein [Phycisphaerae bacterium]|nr:aspartyl protease family protein [Phycisphaerae bacterium]
MRQTFMIALLLALVAGPSALQAADEPACPLFVLKRTDAGLVIETVPLAEGETKVLPANTQTGVIDVILPVGPGGSASLAQSSEGRLLIARRQGDQIRVTDRTADGKDYTRPPRPISDLARCDVRVSVTAADGTRAAFLIRQNRTVGPDDAGPVMDLFAGKVPLPKGACVVCTDTYPHQAGPEVSGQAPLAFDRYLFVKGQLPGGGAGDLIVDVGGAQTVVSRSFLPDGVEIRESSMVEYSAAGKRMLKYTTGGATGKVATVLGHATLPQLQLGGVVLRDYSVAVMEELPDLFGRPVVGILGIDALARCRTLTVEYPSADRPAGRLVWGDRSAAANREAIELPFSIVSGHLVVRGNVNAADVFFIVDTGAPIPFLDGQAARAANVQPDAASGHTVQGLDEGRAQVMPAVARKLRLGGHEFANVELRIGDLPVFATMRCGGQNAGLLGNSFFQQFQRVQIDFQRRVVRLVP